jgi:hypothetical protein
MPQIYTKEEVDKILHEFELKCSALETKFMKIINDFTSSVRTLTDRVDAGHELHKIANVKIERLEADKPEPALKQKHMAEIRNAR